MGHRSRNNQERRHRDKWYAAREQEREQDNDYESEPEPTIIDDNPLRLIRRLYDQVAATKDPNMRINIITEILQLFLSKQYVMHSSGEDAYKKFVQILQMKCAEFASHPLTQNNQPFQELLQQVTAAYR